MIRKGCTPSIRASPRATRCRPGARTGLVRVTPELAPHGIVSGSPVTAIIWFRQDLRIRDSPALLAAVDAGCPLVPLYILDERPGNPWEAGGASRGWLSESLDSLDRDLAGIGSRLVRQRGDPSRILRPLQPGCVFWNDCYEPWIHEQDEQLRAALRRVGTRVETFNASTLFNPGDIHAASGSPFRIYTAFARACEAPPAPRPTPARLPVPETWPESDRLDLLPGNPERANRPPGPLESGLRGRPVAPRRVQHRWLRRYEEHAGDRGHVRAFRRISILVKSGPGRSGASSPGGRARERPSTEASSSGGSSRTISSITSRTCPTARCISASCAFLGGRIPPSWNTGCAAVPDIPLSMPECGSCGRQAGSIAASACSLAPS